MHVLDQEDLPKLIYYSWAGSRTQNQICNIIYIYHSRKMNEKFEMDEKKK
jgi:hypothetical protein